MNHSTQAYFSFLEGSSYEIGRKQGEEIKNMPHAVNKVLLQEPIDEAKFKDMEQMMNEYCPGLSEELRGFADSLHVTPRSLNFFDEALLQPGGCSLGAVLPSKTKDRKTYVLRNYDLSPTISDMRLCTTKVKGKYSHTGFSVCYFGRSEGLNEKGLCVAFASCGMPIGKHPGMKKPIINGLQFMVIVRALLENCQNVEEGISYIENMPIGTNMNLLLTDANGQAALISTYDGERAVERTNSTSEFMIATNHGLFPSIARKENGKLEQSCVRYGLLENHLSSNDLISKQHLKDVTLQEYPKGLTVHNYEQNFGTVHSILFDLDAKQLEFSFGSPIHNKTYKLTVGEALPHFDVKVLMENTDYGPDFWSVIDS
ncbi:choloylglycine hydrolase [Bacillaceae bacterium SIJ1]|uniref:C45 family autoproteolytic acyltransferase/hydolase n=1 Tax=Litoribacterium kuwaitense TaxID=1398745 RepID=UPI0013ECEE5C|nr:C45 family peptidase [Litoribacterium kuwaitense]NGP45660.1 choloylglycine hydrolase [Litoribacterium kuwaitense]